MADTWSRVDQVLQAALLRPPDERDRFLRETCAGDTALEKEVRSLLVALKALPEADRKDRQMARPHISVEYSGGAVYRVVVTQGDQVTRHEVTVTPEDVARFAAGSTPERLLEASFQFLLDREPASAILSRFALPVVERYFPEYPHVISRMV